MLFLDSLGVTVRRRNTRQIGLVANVHLSDVQCASGDFVFVSQLKWVAESLVACLSTLGS